MYYLFSSFPHACKLYYRSHDIPDYVAFLFTSKTLPSSGDLKVCVCVRGGGGGANLDGHHGEGGSLEMAINPTTNF